MFDIPTNDLIVILLAAIVVGTTYVIVRRWH